MNNNNGDKFYTVSELAGELKVNNITIYRLIRDKKLKAVQVGDVYRIRKEDIEAYLKSGETDEVR